MEVSKNIRFIREAKGLTQVDVAERLGTERSNYARLESRDVNLTLKQISDIANALEVSIYEIIGQPEQPEVKNDQSEKIQQLMEKLNITEEVLKAKKRNIKLYKSFIEWTRDIFKTEFSYGKVVAARRLEVGEKVREDIHDLDENAYQFSDEDLKMIGEYMFDIDSDHYLWANFIASTGFIDEKWFIDAYKRKNRKDKIKATPSEAINWVKGVFEFLEDE